MAECGEASGPAGGASSAEGAILELITKMDDRSLWMQCYTDRTISTRLLAPRVILHVAERENPSSNSRSQEPAQQKQRSCVLNRTRVVQRQQRALLCVEREKVL